MIYELSLVAKPDIGPEVVQELTKIVEDVAKEYGGALLVEDDWGVYNFAQPTSRGKKRGHYLNFLYRANTQAQTEMDRRFRINENLIKHMIGWTGEDADETKIVKGYKSPFSKKFNGSITDANKEDGEEGGGAGDDMDRDDRRSFSRRRTCWFTANNFKADWKDPGTYAWLVNEFGKITPARISGIKRKHQKYANQAIKQARQLGIASHLSNRFADRTASQNK